MPMTADDASSKPLIVADATKGIKVNAGIIAKPFREEIKAKTEAMKKAGKGTSSSTNLVLHSRYPFVV